MAIYNLRADKEGNLDWADAPKGLSAKEYQRYKRKKNKKKKGLFDIF